MRSITVAAVLLLAAACRDSEGAASPPPGFGGMLRATKEGREVVAATARGAYCPGDSTLALVAVGPAWTMALSLRTAWPAPTAETLAVGGAGGGPGSARAALRQVAGDVGMALVGAHGRVRITSDSAASGTFDFTAPMAPGSPDSAHVAGSFAGVPVNADLCATP